MSAEIIYLDKVFDEATPRVTLADARALGLKRYFTGTPCKQGHVAERYLSSNCVECVSVDAAKWHAENPEKVQEKLKKYRSNNRTVLRERDAKRARDNPGKVNAKNARRRARKRLAIVTRDADAIMRQISNEGGKCFYCAVDLLPFEGHAEHIIPLSRGGPHAELNLVLSCPRCNIGKHDRLPSEWSRLPKRHATRAIAREREIIEWNDAQILGLGDF
ncbi:HNH endonuclease [Methylocystis parvus]|uniref:HNH endonuclease n=1 Tax=Methylocystis parvus TaxID=134 RepID=UPI003C7556D6